MFGGKKDGENPIVVGAKEKIRKAQMLKQGRNVMEVTSKREGKESSQLVPITIVYGISVIFALILTQGPLQSGAGISSGNPALDKALFGPGYPVFTGAVDTDMMIAVFIRGTAIFLVGGIIPFFTRFWQVFLDRARMNVYVGFWGVSVSLGLIYYLVKDSLIPLLVDVFEILFG